MNCLCKLAPAGNLRNPDHQLIQNMIHLLSKDNHMCFTVTAYVNVGATTEALRGCRLRGCLDLFIKARFHDTSFPLVFRMVGCPWPPWRQKGSVKQAIHSCRLPFVRTSTFNCARLSYQ
jgi:hypothetical protein